MMHLSMQLLLTWSLLVGPLTGNSLILSPSVADRTTPRWPCAPDCVCFAGGGTGNDVTTSRGGGGELCVRWAEVGLLSASRLASVTSLTIGGEPSSSLFAIVGRLSNVRRLLILSDAVGADAEAWSRLFASFRQLDELTVRNSSSAAIAITLSAGGRFLPNLRTLDLSGSGASVVDLSSVWSLRKLEVLDVSGNSLGRLMTTGNDSTCVVEDRGDNATSASAPNSTSGPTTQQDVERCRQSSQSLDRWSPVRVFNASRNQIDVIDVGLFNRKSGRKLEVLDLSFNRVGRLDNATFIDLYSLRSVNLSHNDISDIDVDAFTMTQTGELGVPDVDVGYQATGGKQREEQYYISLASCTRGWLNIQVLCHHEMLLGSVINSVVISQKTLNNLWRLFRFSEFCYQFTRLIVFFDGQCVVC